MSGDEVLYEKKDNHIAVITMNRPEALNAMNRAFNAKMQEAMQAFAADDDVWVAILTGAGRAFCAGRDLKERAADNATGARIRGYGYTLPEIWKPMIAAINGPAVAGGWAQAQRCDIRIAADTAVMGIAESRWNLLAPFSPYLVGQIPMAAIMELLLIARPITAQRAYEIGFLNKVVPLDQLMPTAMEYAHAIVENGPLSVRIHKEIIWRALQNIAQPINPLVIAWYDALNQSEDSKEGPRAFAEKRKPQWQAR